MKIFCLLLDVDSLTGNSMITATIGWGIISSVNFFLKLLTAEYPNLIQEANRASSDPANLIWERPREYLFSNNRRLRFQFFKTLPHESIHIIHTKDTQTVIVEVHMEG